jgi:hypothetical protein
MVEFHAGLCNRLEVIWSASIGHTNRCRVLKKTLWPGSTSKLYRPNDRLLSAKLVPTFASRGCHVVSWQIPTPYSRLSRLGCRILSRT